MPDGTRGLAVLGWPDGAVWPRDEHVPARIAAVHGSLAEACAVAPGEAAGWVRHTGVKLAGTLDVTPVAGDWITMRGVEVMEVLPRRTALSRPSPGGRGRQVLAANLDTVVVTVPVDRGLNQKMAERLTVMAWDSGAVPVLALTKCDACRDVPGTVEQTASLVPGVEVVATSAVTGEGVARLRELMGPGTTSTLLGASGVGKTSLLNVLGGHRERVAAVGRDGEGRHTTTTRRLHFVTGGGVLIDLPGIRALTLSARQEAITDVFTEIAELAGKCRFADCGHEHEPGCAVRQAVETGQLPRRRLDAWDAIQRQLAHEERKHDPIARAAEKAKWKAVSKGIRRRQRG
ncbi:ribosome small subunit-dependent GTPase A [Nonomuraea sp. NPDC050227]|uniref:ribosome small subunit-dependent GTPase A n=1 Tax=Nonomuraea sp. NPDC050227 TaxID=3364360 RepID=UPI00379FEC09